MNKQQLENEIKRLKEELESARVQVEEFERKNYYFRRDEKCHLYDEIFFSIKCFLEGGGEIILRPGVVERGVE